MGGVPRSSFSFACLPHRPQTFVHAFSTSEESFVAQKSGHVLSPWGYNHASSARTVARGLHAYLTIRTVVDQHIAFQRAEEEAIVISDDEDDVIVIYD